MSPVAPATDAASHARAVAYAAYASAVTYPDAEVLGMLRDGTVADALAAAARDCPFALDGGAAAWDVPEDDEAVQAEYIALFETATGAPAVSLYSGENAPGSDRTAQLEEVVRFYNHFGLTSEEPLPEMPDHLSVVLEFLHVLAAREGQVLATGDDPAPYRRAAADFLDRHVLSWLPDALGKVRERATLPLYTDVFTRLLAFARADAAWLRANTPDDEARGEESNAE